MGESIRIEVEGYGHSTDQQEQNKRGCQMGERRDTISTVYHLIHHHLQRLKKKGDIPIESSSIMGGAGHWMGFGAEKYRIAGSSMGYD